MSQTVEVALRTLHPGQQQILAQRKRFNVLMCGRRFGKTAFGEDLADNAALDGLSVGWFAPTYKLLDEAWRALRTTLSPIPGIRANATQMRIELPTNGVIEGWSLEGGDDVARGRKYHLVIIDEAGLVPGLLRIWYAAIRPTLADYEGEAWLLGTPKGIGDFSTCYDYGQSPDYPEWASWRMTTRDNPYIKPTEIDAMKREMPAAIFEQEVEGKPIDDANHPIGLQAIAACVGPLSTKPPVVYGLDLAKSVDYTVLLGLDEDGKVCRFDRFQHPWGLTRGTLGTMMDKKIWTRADSTGVGDPMVEELQRDGYPVEGIVLNARNKQQAVETLIAAIQQKQITFPDGHIKAELYSLTCERTAYGIRYEALEGRHDDCVIALAFAVEGWKLMGYGQPLRTTIDRVRMDTDQYAKEARVKPDAREVHRAPWESPSETPSFPVDRQTSTITSAEGL